MKVAHVIMAHTNPEQIGRMIRALDHPNFFFFINLDLKINYQSYHFLSQMDRVFFIENRSFCNWGGYSFVKGILSALQEILSVHRDFAFINLISGQDYPIKSPNFIYDFYERNPNKCYISYDNDPTKQWWRHAIKRSEHYHLTDFNFRGKYLVQHLLNRYFPKRKFPSNMKLYGSSNSSWWTITPDCALYILDFMKRHPKLEDFMKYTWGADEFLVATIIMNSDFKHITVNNNHRLISWANGLARPKVLTVEDFELIKFSEHLYARKFNIRLDAEILNKIDEIIRD